MHKYTKYLAAAACCLVLPLLTGCLKDLDQYPHTDTTSKDVYTTVENYEAVLSGIYTSMIVNISSIADDDRYQNYTRCLTMFQECSTDTVDDVWLAGETMTDVSFQSWNAGDPWVSAMYYHIYNIIALSNEFIRNSSEDAISGFSETDKEKIRSWRDEARGLRALAYYHQLDFFNVASFVTENDNVGSRIPEVYTRKQLFSYIESELKEIGESLPSRNYGHFTKSAANTLLARLYLNAEVYTGEGKWNECIAACNKVLADGYSALAPSYSSLFNADNHKRAEEIIFALACDSENTLTWGAGTYLVCAGALDNYCDMLKDFGVSSNWNCLRMRPQLVDLFNVEGDARARFCQYDRQACDYEENEKEKKYDIFLPGDETYKYRLREKTISKHEDATTGWRIQKWSNLTDAGEPSSVTGSVGADTDYPVFRLADVYLMLAEASLRGGSGAAKTALEYVNLVRERAFGGTSGDISASDLTVDFVLDERARELYTEGVRRTDLIRFGKYTSGYAWNWKGGVIDGKDVDKKYCVLPIPEAELSANPGLKAYNTELGY